MKAPKDIKILYINDYGCNSQMYNEVQTYQIGSHHFWGVSELIDNGYNVDFLDVNGFPSISGIKNPIVKLLKSIKRKIYLRTMYLKYKDYDVIYSAQSYLRQTDYFAKYKKKGKVSARLITVLHHPACGVVDYESNQRILFLSNNVLDFHKYENGKAFVWGPDLRYYDYWIKQFSADVKPKSGDLIFMSNGKALRDNDCFVQAAQKLNAKTILFCDKHNRPDDIYLNDKNNTIYGAHSANKTVSETDNLKLILQADVMIIPVIESSGNLCGLTSFVDAIALSKPIIMSDNTRIDIDIEAEGFGFVYKVSNKDDLASKMKQFIDNPLLIKTMGLKARKFAERNNFADTWAKDLEKEIIG